MSDIYSKYGVDKFKGWVLAYYPSNTQRHNYVASTSFSHVSIKGSTLKVKKKIAPTGSKFCPFRVELFSEWSQA